ncbi:hypothetical protein CEE37_11955 [candidate division LCP-89 bacterium B3_LCP]|uniref:DUF362 domain-containing protein n=1 Tax=candidate division LCP-89 bacterium B3_LCP TaxID=2012998 RepID=A0A532UW14_UNCL8|nr:MAG: hypothetical protein CEE37_11955 [candidate division LCP-89 bacterium B3_LCP]
MKKGRESKGINRRTFIKTATGAAAAFSIPTGAFHILSRKSEATDLWRDPRVVTIKDVASHQGSQLDQSIVQVMMDEAIRRYTEINNIGEAYHAIFPNITTDDVIGIKVNCINSSLPTHPEMVNALINGLTQMDVGGSPFPENNVIIWDRSSWELSNSGYTLNSGATGVRCMGTNSVGYNSLYLNCAGSYQHPSNILTDYCNYLIDFAVLKNHSTAGITLAMKNHLGSIQSPGSLHPGYCDPYIPALNQQIRDVLAVEETLHIIDAVFGCYSGGPGGSPNMVYEGIIMGEDRVAIDAVGRDILDDAGCSTIYRATHVDTAANPPYSLGVANLSSIEQIVVEDPSTKVRNLQVTKNYPDVTLDWSTPEYSGVYKVQRSIDPEFGTYDEIATLNENSYIDAGILTSNDKYFYRVVKTWG